MDEKIRERDALTDTEDGEDMTSSKNGGIIRSILIQGDGGSSPNDGATVEIAIKGMYKGRIFDTRDLKFDLDYGLEYDIVSGIEKALRKFKCGEKSLLMLSPKYAFGTTGSEIYNIPADATVQYEVQLFNFLKAKEHWDMGPSEKLELAMKQKDHGTFLFKRDCVAKALRMYKKAVKSLEYSPGYTEEESKLRESYLLSLHLNCALCLLKLESWNGAVDSSDMALQIDSINEKALFRKAQALLGRKDYEEAISNFQKLVSHYPTNQAAHNGIISAKQLVKRERLKLKNHYNGMFEKFAKKDEQKETLDKSRSSINDEPIGYWSNEMADGMISLHQEMEAFGEKMPEKSTGGGNSSPKH